MHSSFSNAFLQSSYRKAVTAARRDKKNGKQGLTEEQKQEIRCGERVHSPSC